MKIEHRFYIKDKEILELPNSAWCDTANPYIYTANELHRINNLLKKGEVIFVVSNGNEIKIRTSKGLGKWIIEEFNCQSNGGFEKYIENGYK